MYENKHQEKIEETKEMNSTVYRTEPVVYDRCNDFEERRELKFALNQVLSKLDSKRIYAVITKVYTLEPWQKGVFDKRVTNADGNELLRIEIEGEDILPLEYYIYNTQENIDELVYRLTN